MSSEQKPLTGTTAEAVAPGTATGRGVTLRTKDDSRSLVALEILLYANLYYAGIFWLCEILMFIYKGQSMPYPFGLLAGEVILTFAVGIVELIRIALCSHGNLAAYRVSSVIGIILTLLTILGVIYLLFFQLYTLWAELVTCSIALVFQLLGIILTIASLIFMS